ncbi:MAG: FUSC family protein [Nocardioidaceae bacterium]
MTADVQPGEGNSSSGFPGYLAAKASRLNAALGRARGHAGYERDTALLVVKNVVAATVAWVIANVALGLPAPAFAPFTAILMLQSTVYRSVRQALQYVLAVIIGVGVEAGLGFTLGPTVATFAVLAFAAVLIGRWRKLENQGSQVATAAFFAYSMFVTTTSASQRLTHLAEIVLLVVIGAACGIVANLAYPPLRYRSVEHSIARLTSSLADLLSDMWSTLADRPPDATEADDWLYRARQFDQSVAEARAAITHAEESVRWNPRRLIGAHPSAFTGYRAVVDALGRAGEQVRGIAQALSDLPEADQDEHDPTHSSFLSSYAQLLSAATEAVQDLGYVDQLRHYGDVDSLTQHIQCGRDHYQDLADQVDRQELDTAGQWPLYGGLLIDANRLIEEFETARQQLADNR